MTIILKIAILFAGIWAALRPATYGALFLSVFDSSAIIDFLVLGSCIIIVWDAFKTMPRLIWVTAFVFLLVATTIGFIQYFRDSGESGPLAYEWLNEYYKFTVPLITLSLINCFFKFANPCFKRGRTINKKAEPGAQH